MTKPGDREAFRLVDGGVLIAATAFTLAAIRIIAATPTGFTFYTPYSMMVKSAPTIQERLKDSGFLTTAGSALLIFWSIALLGLGWWRGRRGLGLIFSRPGLLACAWAVVMLLCVTAYLPTVRTEISVPQGAPLQLPEGMATGMIITKVLDFLKQKVGVCVMIAWVTLAASRSWRKPIGWIEWAGLAIGIGWIAIWLASLALG